MGSAREVGMNVGAQLDCARRTLMGFAQHNSPRSCGRDQAAPLHLQTWLLDFGGGFFLGGRQLVGREFDVSVSRF